MIYVDPIFPDPFTDMYYDYGDNEEDEVCPDPDFEYEFYRDEVRGK